MWFERNFYFVTIWFSKKNESSKNILFWFFTFFLIFVPNMRAPGGSCCFYFLFDYCGQFVTISRCSHSFICFTKHVCTGCVHTAGLFFHIIYFNSAESRFFRDWGGRSSCLLLRRHSFAFLASLSNQLVSFVCVHRVCSCCLYFLFDYCGQLLPSPVGLICLFV